MKNRTRACSPLSYRTLRKPYSKGTTYSWTMGNYLVQVLYS